jgi:membrane protein YdbS with pleckstrin-like domain
MSLWQRITMRWRIANPVNPILTLTPVVPPGVADYLLPYENRIITVRKHPAIFVPHSMLLACGCAAASVLTAVTDADAVALVAAWGACALIWLYLIARGVNWLYEYFVVSDVRLIFITGLVKRKITTVPIREIADLELRRSPMGRLLGYGRFIAEPSRRGYRMPRINYMPYPELLFVEVVAQLFPDGKVNTSASLKDRAESAKRRGLAPRGLLRNLKLSNSRTCR